MSCTSRVHTPDTVVCFFFFNDTATTEIYTFPTRRSSDLPRRPLARTGATTPSASEVPFCSTPPTSTAKFSSTTARAPARPDRKSTRLNSSHLVISYAVFCLKKKQTHLYHTPQRCHTAAAH